MRGGDLNPRPGENRSDFLRFMSQETASEPRMAPSGCNLIWPPRRWRERYSLGDMSRASLRRFGSPSASLWDSRVVGAAEVTLHPPRIDLDGVGRLREWLAV